MDLINSLANSIATMEGYFKPGTLAQQNNNPGNLRSWGSNPTRNGFAVFATPEEGWAALRQQIQRNISRGLTLSEFFGGKEGVYPGYAPAADQNRPDAYARFVAGRAGIAVDQPLTAYLGGGTAAPGAVTGPSWDVLPDESWMSDERLIYAGIAAIALAAMWAVSSS